MCSRFTSGTLSLGCPDPTHLVGGAQTWDRHKWQVSDGPVHHVDLWTQMLDLPLRW